MHIEEDICESFGLDPKQVKSIASRLSKAAKEAESIGLTIFGGSGDGSLRFNDAERKGPGHSVVAKLDGIFDGGDGGDVY